MVHKAVLPEGWYPHSEKELLSVIEALLQGNRPDSLGITGGVVPHAGWFFCAELMCRVVSLLPKDTETVVVAGGHLPAGGPCLVYLEDGYETPLGDFVMDEEFRDALFRGGDFSGDRRDDNTVEVVLPMLKYFLPRARLVGMRLPPDETALETGRLIFRLSEELGRKTVVIGSTDLTHYGPNYGFRPPESLDDPEGWVRKRDEKIIRRMVDLDGPGVLAAARQDDSACSAGGAAAALAFASAHKNVKGTSLGYSTSLSGHRSSSFVGYTGIVYNY